MIKFETQKTAAVLKIGDSRKPLKISLWVVEECLLCLRSKFTKFNTEMLPFLTKNISHKNSNISQQCLTLLLSMINQPDVDLQVVMELVKNNIGMDNLVRANNSDKKFDTSKMPSLEITGINKTNCNSRVLWIKICFELIQSAKFDRDYIDLLKNEICDFLFDESERVVLTAVDCIIEFGWIWIQRVLVYDTACQLKISVLKLLKARIISSLSNSSTPVIYAATRVTTKFVKSYTCFFEPTTTTTTYNSSSQATTESMSVRGRSLTTYFDHVPEDDNPLNDLKGALQTVFKNSKSSYVRTQVVLSYIWIEYPHNGIILEELISPMSQTIQSHLLTHLFQVFLERVQHSPELISTLLNIYYHICLTAPANLDISSLLSTWEACMRINNTCKLKVLKNTFDILNANYKKDTRLITYNIHRATYWFLGEHAPFLTAEVISALPTFSTIVNDVAHFPISNSLLIQIISYLEKAIILSPWEIRLVCIEALAKIAFQSSYPVKLRIYELLNLLAHSQGSALFPLCIPILHLLDRIFEIRSRWASQYEHGQKLTTESSTSLREDIKILKDQIQPYCDLKFKNIIGPDML